MVCAKPPLRVGQTIHFELREESREFIDHVENAM